MSAESAVIVAWGLVGVRVLAFLTTAPLFGQSVVPVRLRGALAALLAAVLVAGVPAAKTAVPSDPIGIGLAAAVEFGLGAALGFASRLVFDGVALLGQVAAIQGGLGHATVLDPTSGASTVALASLYQSFALLLFLAIDGDRLLIQSLGDSLRLVPPGGRGLPPLALVRLAGLGGEVFAIALRLAAPVVVAMFVANLAFGLLGRTLPQLNLMTVQLPAHIAVTLLLLALGAAHFGSSLAGILGTWMETARRAVFAAAAGGI